MSQEENTGKRDLTYSIWHRRQSTKRFVGIEKAQLLAQIDLDCCIWVEYDEKTKIPLALIETAIDIGQKYKNATVTYNLSRMAKIPSYIVLYKISLNPNPSNPNYRDIESFRVRNLYPDNWTLFQIFTPKQWAERLLQFRQIRTKVLDANERLSFLDR